MENTSRYDRALHIALKLIAFVHEKPDVPEYVLVGTFVYLILDGLKREGDREDGLRFSEPSGN